MNKIIFKSFILLVTLFTVAGCTEPFDWNSVKDIIIISDCEVSFPKLNSINISFTSQKNNEIKIKEVYIKYDTKNYSYCPYNNKTNIESFNPNGQNSIEINELKSNNNYAFKICVRIEGVNEIVVYEFEKYIPDKNSFIPSPLHVKLTANEIYSSIYAECDISEPANSSLFPIIEAGFFYGLNSDVTYETGTIIQGTVDNNNVLTAEITDLNYLQKYYVGAFVKTQEGIKTTNIQQATVTGLDLGVSIDELIPKEKGFGIKFTISKYDPTMTINNITLEISAYSGRISPEWNITSLYAPTIQNNSERTTLYIYDLLNETLTNSNIRSNERFSINFIVNVTKNGKSLYKTISSGQGTWDLTTL